MDQLLVTEIPKRKYKKKAKLTENSTNVEDQSNSSVKKLKSKKSNPKKSENAENEEIPTSKKSNKRQKIAEVDDIDEDPTADCTMEISKPSLSKAEELERIKKEWTAGPDMAPNGALLPEVNIDAYPEGDEGIENLRKYAKSVGFIIKIDRSWTGFKKCICNRNSKQLVGDCKFEEDKKQCPWEVTFKRDNDKMWRFKKIINYHNHSLSGIASKSSESVEILKSLSCEIKRKVDTYFFDLGKPKRDIVSEFKILENVDGTQADKIEKQSEKSLQECDVSKDLIKNDDQISKNDIEISKSINESKDNSKCESYKAKSEPPVRVGLLNNYLSSYVYPKEEDFTEFCKYLKSQFDRTTLGGFISIHYNNNSCIFSICKKDILELYSDIIFIDSDFESDTLKVPNHKTIMTFLGINEHGSLIPLFIWILNDCKIKTMIWIINEIVNNALKGKHPKMFILDMDYHLFLALMNIYDVDKDYKLNFVYDVFQVSKRLFNSLFLINNSKYKSGEICKEFIRGAVSSDKAEYIKVINKLYATYAQVFPKIKELLTILMRNRNKIAYAHLGEFSFTKNIFSDNAKILWNVIKRSPLRNQSFKDMISVYNRIMNSTKQTPAGVDFVDYIKSGMTIQIEEGQKKQYKYMISPFSISILDELIQISAGIWRCKKIWPNSYKWEKVEWIEGNRNRISEFNTSKYYEKNKCIMMQVLKTEINWEWYGRDSVPNLPCLHIIALFILEKVNIKLYLQFLTGKRWENTKSDVGRKRKLAEELPFFIDQENKAEKIDNNINNEEIIYS